MSCTRIIPKPSLPLWSVEKLSSPKPVPGAKKVGTAVLEPPNYETIQGHDYGDTVTLALHINPDQYMFHRKVIL